MEITRRQFCAAVGAAVAFPALPAAALEVRGVELGLQGYTFHMVREGGLAAADTMIAAMKQLNVNLLELWSPLIEPFPVNPFYWGPFATPPVKGERPSPEAAKTQREKLRAWREHTPGDFFPALRKKFSDAGIRVFAYNYSFEKTMSDAEIDAGFLQAKALGLNLITASSMVSLAERVVPFAKKHNMQVAFHNHSILTNPDEVATPESLLKVLAMSPLYRINLDCAHFAAAGFDAVPFMKEHHAVITNIHVHDRKANDGISVPFGEGVAKTGEVLRLIRDNKWKIPVFYELEYVGADGRDVVAETRRELAYEKRMLES